MAQLLFKYYNPEVYDADCTDAVDRLFNNPNVNSGKVCLAGGSFDPRTLDGLRYWFRLYITEEQDLINQLESQTFISFSSVI